MFRKSKEAKASIKEHDASHQQLEKQFDSSMEKAGQITDPAEKVLELEKIQKLIRDQIRNEKSAIAKKAQSKDDHVFFGSLGAAAATGTAVGLLGGPLGVPLGLVSSVGVWGASAVVGSHRNKTTRKKLNDISRSHLDNLAYQAARASEMTDETVKNNVEEISQSPLLGQIRALPGMAPKFAAAAAKHIVDAKAAAEAGAAATADDEQLKSPVLRKRKSPNYRDITDGPGPK